MVARPSSLTPRNEGSNRVKYPPRPSNSRSLTSARRSHLGDTSRSPVSPPWFPSPSTNSSTLPPLRSPGSTKSGALGNGLTRRATLCFCHLNLPLASQAISSPGEYDCPVPHSAAGRSAITSFLADKPSVTANVSRLQALIFFLLQRSPAATGLTHVFLVLSA